MRLSFARLPVIISILSGLIGLMSSSGHADLVWTKETGWSVEGGALAGLAGAEGRNALDQMNKARAAEEAGSRRSAKIKATSWISAPVQNDRVG